MFFTLDFKETDELIEKLLFLCLLSNVRAESRVAGCCLHMYTLFFRILATADTFVSLEVLFSADS